MEDKIISVLNNVRTNLSNELETKRKELVKLLMTLLIDYLLLKLLH